MFDTQLQHMNLLDFKELMNEWMNEQRWCCLKLIFDILPLNFINSVIMLPAPADTPEELSGQVIRRASVSVSLFYLNTVGLQ